MDILHALKIMRSLSAGVNPDTGEQLSADHLLRKEKTIQALTTSVHALEVLQEKIERREQLPKNAGKPWGVEEDQELIKEYRCGQSMKEIAKKHFRSDGAITSRLIKLGEIKISRASP